MVPVSPSLAWRWSLPGTPDCCRRARPSDSFVSEAPRATTVVSSFERRQLWKPACVRVPGRGRERVQEVAEFQTTVRGLLSVRDWLKAHRVRQVAMEATGVYWKPVWAILEDEFDCLLVDAAMCTRPHRLQPPPNHIKLL